MSDAPLPADHLVRDCAQKPAAISWPLPVDMRLEGLLAQADAAGENTSRKELAAAIIASTKLTDAQLGKLLRWYRKVRVRGLLAVPDVDNVVHFTRRKPGPRSSAPPRGT